MAERRMLAKSIIFSDQFLTLAPRAQMLYVAYDMMADDDGLLENFRTVMSMVRAGIKHHLELVHRGLILEFSTGVIAIKHWKRHNYIRSDRYTPTVYLAEKKGLKEDENGDYYQLVYQRCTEDRIGKDRLGKVKEKCAEARDKVATVCYGSNNNVRISPQEYQSYLANHPNGQQAIDYLSDYVRDTGYNKSHIRALNTWVLDALRERDAKQLELKLKESRCRDYVIGHQKHPPMLRHEYTKEELANIYTDLDTAEV